jgi:hypothetical protein
LFLNAVPSSAQLYKIRTQLELRKLQTRVYNTSDTKRVFKATINTLQDNGYAVINVEDTLGYISARKEYKEKRTDGKRVVKESLLIVGALAATAVTYGAFAPYVGFPVKGLQNELADKTIIIDTNANIEPYGDATKVRLTFVERVLENADGYSYVKSSPRDVVRIYTPLVYQDFFNQIGKSIFYEKI